MTTHETEADPTTTYRLDIGGMSCTSCAMRIEKKLNRLEGVEASVNYATEKATVHAHHGVDPQALVETVERTGYTAQVHDPHAGHEGHAAHGGAFPVRLPNAGVIGVVTVSGLPQADDHALVVEAIETFLHAG